MLLINTVKNSLPKNVYFVVLLNQNPQWLSLVSGSEPTTIQKSGVSKMGFLYVFLEDTSYHCIYLTKITVKIKYCGIISKC